MPKKKPILVSETLSPSDLGHWSFSKEITPSEWVGFVYCITNLDTNRQYIGKKTFWSHRSKKVTNKLRRTHFTKESNWKKYTGSSNELNFDIEQLGKDRFSFDIVSLHDTKATLAYREVELLIKMNALRAKLATGERKYYNGLIPPIRFNPGIVSDREKEYDTFGK